MTATRLYLPNLFAAEAEVAHYLNRFLKVGCDSIRPVTDGLEDQQPYAVEQACCNSLSILYGRPGTGKTTTLKRIIQSFDQSGLRGIIGTPTGKAAKRADEVLSSDGSIYSQRPKSVTTFRALGYNPSRGYTYNHEKQLDVDYFILEEASMESLEDARNVFAAINPERTRVVLVGDPYQLPSVGAGNFLYDCIQSDRIAKVELQKIFRQGPNSGIVYNAARVLKGEMPSKNDPATGDLFTDFYFVPTKHEDETFTKILDWATEKIPAQRKFDPVMDIQILAPGKKSTVGVKNLNDKLRERLNPESPARPMGYRGFRLGDKVINKKNNYNLDIVNGDVGKVIEIGKEGMVVDFGAGTGKDGTGKVQIEKDAGDSIFLAYAYTVHGSQGSEFACQITPVHRCHYTLLFQNLIYTAMTRAKQLSMIVGDPDAFRHAIQNTVTDKRQTGLGELLLALGA
jgi:exodeoxyribonuclease V alpha subunit